MGSQRARENLLVTKTKIIKEQWKLVGAKYSQGKALWDELQDKYGNFDSMSTGQF
jgi:hypothetical protein